MSRKVLLTLIGILIAMVATQQLTINAYHDLNAKLLDSLGECTGAKKV